MQRRMVKALAGVLAVVVSGCTADSASQKELVVSATEAQTYLQDKPSSLKKHFYVALAQGPRNRVLNDMRLGLASLHLGETQLAESLFEDALQGIETVYSNSDSAKQARALFSKEEGKDFKGEPYERVMAYYYRGLLYFMSGDYSNAHAAFKGGMSQDTFPEEDQDKARFSLMPYLGGWSAQCSGNALLAQDDFKEFSELNAKVSTPKTGDNVLVVVETGDAPIKSRRVMLGQVRPQFLQFHRKSTTESAEIILSRPATATQAKPKAAAEVETVRIPVPMIEDIFERSTTRGGRQFDGILAGKVQFKTSTDAVGSKIGDITSYVGGGLGFVGALVGGTLKSMAHATEVDADARYWDNLPDRVHGVSLALPPGQDSVMVAFNAPDGEVLRVLPAKITWQGRCGLAWVRGMTATPSRLRAPYSVSDIEMGRPVTLPPSGSNPR